MTHDFYKFWLKITAFVIGSFGPICFLGTMDSTLEPARFTLDVLSWPVDGEQTYESSDTRLLSALLGGFLLGWGVMIWRLSGAVYDAAPEGVRQAVLTGLVCWFVLDSAGSIAGGHASNALFNVAILVVAVGPMWRPVRGWGVLER